MFQFYYNGFNTFQSRFWCWRKIFRYSKADWRNWLWIWWIYEYRVIIYQCIIIINNYDVYLSNFRKQEKHEDFFKIKNSLRVYHDIIVDELNEESDIFEDHFNENENTERLSEHIKTYNSFLEMTEALEYVILVLILHI